MPSGGEPSEHNLPPPDGDMLEALQRVTDAALTYLPPDELLRELLQRVAEVLSADSAAIMLMDPGGENLRPMAVTEPEKAVQVPLGQGFAGRVAAERRAIAIEHVDPAQIVNPVLRERGFRSLLGVPLLAEGKVLGVLYVGSLLHRVFNDEEQNLLQLAADRAAVAIVHAQLNRQEQRARAGAEAVSRRLQALQSVTDAALAYLSPNELLTELLERISAVLTTDTAAILLLEPNGEYLHARAAKGIEEEVERGVRIPVGRGFAGRIAAERRPVMIEDVDHADIMNPILREKGIRSLLGVPLLLEGRVLGVLHVGSLVPRTFTEEERDVLQLAADRAAVAIEQANLYEQRRLAEAMQQRLLPSDMSMVPGLELTSRYLPASGESLGGDWYDAFPVANGRVVLAVGDVVGHGLAAAAVMAQLRTALRAYAAEGHPPAEVVERVNRLMLELGPTAMTTLALVAVDLERETLELVNAGHLPPLLIPVEGEPYFLPMQEAIPMGVQINAQYQSDTHRFEAGSILVLYTDGLVESRQESIEVGLKRLRDVSAPAESLEAVCQGLIDRLVTEERADDIAIIAARLPPLPESFTGRWAAEVQSLPVVRQLLARWLRARGVSKDESYDILVACQEACSNAVEHAYRPGRGFFEVEAVQQGHRVRVTVRDEGRWRPPRGADRGRGRELMDGLMDLVDIQHEGAGTRVSLERTLQGERR